MGIFSQAASRAQNSKKKGGGIKGFFKGVFAELKKVHWPTRKQLITYTGVVIFAVLIMAVVISAFDWIITGLLSLILGS